MKKSPVAELVLLLLENLLPLPVTISRVGTFYFPCTVDILKA